MEQLLYWKSAVIFGCLCAFFILERIAPKESVEKGTGRLLSAGGLWTANLIVSPLIILPITGLATALSPVARPEGWAGPWALVLDLLILDLWIYFMHRTMHVVPFFWRFHEVHHLDETLDTASALRFHFGEVIISALARSIVVAALGVPLTHIVAFEILVFCAAIFHHSNIRLPRVVERPVSWLIVTPSHHWVHHHAVQRDTDSNYATILSLWDRLFATRSPTARFPHMPIGVEGETDRPLITLLLRPFRKSHAAPSSQF